MPWKSQGGGPWGSGGGGQGPFSGRGPGGPQPPDIEEMLRRGQDRVRRVLPGGLGSGRGILLIGLAVLVIWMGSGFYRVQPGEQGVELLFGEFLYFTEPGLNYWWPAPVGEIYRPNVEKTNTITVGFRGAGAVGFRGGEELRQGGRSRDRDMPQESLMLTAGQNIIDIDFVVQWRIKNAADFLFNIRNPEGTVKIVAESAMREVIGQTQLEDALTKNRQQVEQQTRELLQKVLDTYGAGVHIAQLKTQQADPPAEVIDAFNDVQRARQDKERAQNEAIAYRNDILPRAKGESQKIVQAARAYKKQVVKEAEGEAERFLAVYEAYRGNKAVTKRRLYLERMQQILPGLQKVIIDSGGPGVVPYLPLPELGKRAREAGQ